MGFTQMAKTWTHPVPICVRLSALQHKNNYVKGVRAVVKHPGRRAREDVVAGKNEVADLVLGPPQRLVIDVQEDKVFYLYFNRDGETWNMARNVALCGTHCRGVVMVVASDKGGNPVDLSDKEVSFLKSALDAHASEEAAMVRKDSTTQA